MISWLNKPAIEPTKKPPEKSSMVTNFLDSSDLLATIAKIKESRTVPKRGTKSLSKELSATLATKFEDRKICLTKNPLTPPIIVPNGIAIAEA